MDDNYFEFDETPYDTSPVASVKEAVLAFVAAYDGFRRDVADFYSEYHTTIRAALYRPVKNIYSDSPAISIFEIGIQYFPKEDSIGVYAVNENKLDEALRFREHDLYVLFAGEDGLLDPIEILIKDFLQEEDLPENIYNPAMKFLNETRRLKAMLT